MMASACLTFIAWKDVVCCVQDSHSPWKPRKKYREIDFKSQKSFQKNLWVSENKTKNKSYKNRIQDR